ncbi:MAG: hypothetical protein HYS25_13825 [Ignavibacteriales bacterium]|nr:hypothetical protein [Ignavibacteriales bacterium]
MLKRREKEIELLGTKINLYERTAGEVQSFAEFVKQNYPNGNVDITTSYVLSLNIIHDSIRPNLKPFLWITNFKHWWRFKCMMNTRFMIKNLTTSQIMDLSKIIIEELELTPADGEKKKD